MWTYLLGPIGAVFPVAWRKSLPFSDEIQWGRAAAISGLAESALALVGMMYWYSYAMTTWVGNGVAAALDGKIGPGVAPQEIGAVALTIWATHPLTWLLGYAGFEGILRLGAAAFTGNSFGTLPFFLIDKVVCSPIRRRKRAATNSEAGVRENVSSYVGAIRERVKTARVPEVPDELCFTKSASGEILEIHACRRKTDWTPPRVVRYLDAYYRLESDSSGTGPRPFHYQLRRLPAGVPGRTVLLYAPADAVTRSAG